MTSRRHRHRNWGLPAPVPAWIGVDYTCCRGGHNPQVWKVRRDVEGPDAGTLWWPPRPDRLTPEPVDFAEHPRLLFLCPTCGHEVVFTLDTVNAHLDAVAAAGRRVWPYPL
jgi:hypothetical protein